MANVLLPGGDGETRQRRRLDGGDPNASAAGAAASSSAAPAAQAIDPFVTFSIADELVDKLLILDYRAQFCAKYDLKPISRVFFAIVRLMCACSLSRVCLYF